MVSKQLLFDPQFAIEDKPQGKKGDKAQPVAGDREQAQSPKQKTGIHGMPDIAIRAVGNENGPALDGREDIEMTRRMTLTAQPASRREAIKNSRAGRLISRQSVVAANRKRRTN